MTAWSATGMCSCRTAWLQMLYQAKKQPYDPIVSASTTGVGSVGANRIPRPDDECSTIDHARIRPVPYRRLTRGATSAPTTEPTAATDMTVPNVPADRCRPWYARTRSEERRV